MRITKKEWDAFIQGGGALKEGLDDAARSDPIRQVPAAAFRMHSDIKALSKLRTTAADGNDPFVPEFIDVFFAYLTDSPDAALALRDAHTNAAHRSEPVDKFLGPLTPDQIKALHASREKFFGTPASPKPLEDAVSNAKAVLDEAFKKAFELLKQHIPEAIPVASEVDSSAPGTTFNEKAPHIMRNLIRDFGFTENQAAGILGNLGHETGGFTLFQELRPRSGRGGFGWAQWTGGRRLEFEKFCRDNGFDQKSDEGNYGFLRHEMKNTSERKVVDALKATTTLEKAVEAFERVFERAGVVALTSRITWGRRALAAFRAPPTAGTGGGVAGGAGGTVVQQLESLIAANKIRFDEPRLKQELLRANSGLKISPKLQALVLKLVALVKPTEHLRISSLVRASAGHHGAGRAVDIGNQEIARDFLPQFATPAKVAALGIDELIYNAGGLDAARPQKFNFNDGAPFPRFDDRTMADHLDHIHVSVKA